MSVTQRFCKEAITWKALRHQNVLPLLGVTMGNNQFAMVSEWMANGNINEFVKAHSDANRFELVRPCSNCKSYLPLMESFPIARRRLSGVELYARSGDDTRGLEGGMISDVSNHAAI